MILSGAFGVDSCATEVCVLHLPTLSRVSRSKHGLYVIIGIYSCHKLEILKEGPRFWSCLLLGKTAEVLESTIVFKVVLAVHSVCFGIP